MQNISRSRFFYVTTLTLSSSDIRLLTGDIIHFLKEQEEIILIVWNDKNKFKFCIRIFFIHDTDKNRGERYILFEIWEYFQYREDAKDLKTSNKELLYCCERSIWITELCTFSSVQRDATVKCYSSDQITILKRLYQEAWQNKAHKSECWSWCLSCPCTQQYGPE